MRYSFSANTGFLWKDRPFLERIARAGAAGFHAVEFHDEAQRETLSDVKAALAEAGLPLLGLNTRMGDTAGCAAIPGEEDRARGDFAKALDAARTLGGTAIHVIGGRLDAFPGVAREAAMETYAAALKAFALEAERHGLTLLVEPICPQAMPSFIVPDMATGAALLERVGAPNVKLMFDCFHVQRATGDLVETFRAHAHRIGHVQIAGGLTRAEPDQGEIDYGFVLPALREAGYEGAFGCEYVAKGLVEEGLGWRDRFV
ncbi:MAG: TIM barrel protein [Pseudomonadota bacterium]